MIHKSSKLVDRELDPSSSSEKVRKTDSSIAARGSAAWYFSKTKSWYILHRLPSDSLSPSAPPMTSRFSHGACLLEMSCRVVRGTHTHTHAVRRPDAGDGRATLRVSSGAVSGAWPAAWQAPGQPPGRLRCASGPAGNSYTCVAVTRFPHSDSIWNSPGQHVGASWTTTPMTPSRLSH